MYASIKYFLFIFFIFFCFTASAQHDSTATADSILLKQIETHLYGSSRLGILGEQTVLSSTVNLTGGFSAA